MLPYAEARPFCPLHRKSISFIVLNWAIPGPIFFIVDALNPKPKLFTSHRCVFAQVPICQLGGQWLCYRWQRGRFQNQSTRVRIQSRANLLNIYCLLFVEKTKNKLNRGRERSIKNYLGFNSGKIVELFVLITNVKCLILWVPSLIYLYNIAQTDKG